MKKKICKYKATESDDNPLNGDKLYDLNSRGSVNFIIITLEIFIFDWLI